MATNHLNQTTDAKHIKKQQRTPEVTPQVESQYGLSPAFDSTLDGLVFGGGDVNAQANILANTNIQTVQRQAIANRIGEKQGNLHLHQTIARMKTSQQGDGGAGQSSRSIPIQTKLAVNEPNDLYEQEADLVADTVIGMPAFAPALPGSNDDASSPAWPGVQRMPDISSMSANNAAENTVSPDVEGGINRLQQGGQPLPGEERNFFQQRIGADFGDVRIHTGSEANLISRKLNARAFTVGNHIAFNDNEYQPGTEAGRHLMAHELTHVVQQTGSPAIARQIDEHEAEDATQAQSPAELQEVTDSRGVMDAELAEATGDGETIAQQEEGQPTILMPAEEPETPAEQAANLTGNAVDAGDSATPDATDNQALSTDNQTSATETLIPADYLQYNAQNQLTDIDPTFSTSNDLDVLINPSLPTNNGDLNLELGFTPPNPQLTDIASTAHEEIAEESTPDAVREQIPSEDPPVEEFMAAMEAEETAEEDKAQVQQLLAGLEASAEEQKATLLTEAETQKAQVMMLAEEQAALVQSILQEQTTALQELYQTARTDLQTTAEQAKADVTDQVSQEIEQVNTDTETRIADAEEQLTQRKTDFLAFIDEQQQQPSTIAESEISRANGELDGAANEAIAIGENEASNRSNGEAQAAARQLANDSASDIRAKKGDIAGDLRARANEFAAKYPEYGQKISQEIDDVKANLTPAMRQKSQQVITELQGGQDATLQIIDQKLQTALQQLDTAEQTNLTSLETKDQETTTQIQTMADETTQGIDTTAEMITVQIDQTVSGVSGAVSDEEEPHVPGITAMLEGTQASLAEMVTSGSTQLLDLTTAATESMTELTTTFETDAMEIVTTAEEKVTTTIEETTTTIEETLEMRQEAAEASIENLAQKHDDMLTEALAEVDPAIEAAEEEVRSLTEQFRSEITPATDQSIAEAKMPLTDPLQTRVCEAADQAEESWLSGLFRAIGDIVVGLVIMVAVALVVAAIAAALGVVLTAWSAIMIAGAILLLIGLGLSLFNRFTQEELTEESWWKKAGLAVMDTVGLTGITQAITGEDIVTGEELNAGERTHDGVMGAFTLVSLVLGARAAIKGPGAGGYTRPVTEPTGWRWIGWRETIPTSWRGRALKGMENVGLELYTSLRMGTRNIGAWFQERFGTAGEVVPGDAGFTDPLNPRGWRLAENGEGHHMYTRGTTEMTSEAIGNALDTPETPRYYPESNNANPTRNAGEAHVNLHRILREFGLENGRRPNPDMGTIHEHINSYHQAYADPSVSGIEGSLRTPNGDFVASENATPLEAYNALLEWFGYGNARPYVPVSGLDGEDEDSCD